MSLAVFIHQTGLPLERYESLDVLKNAPEGATVWVDLETEDPKEMAAVAEHFGLHELTIEDCLTPGHFPKIEVFGTYVFLLLRSLKPWSVVEDIWKALSSQLEETDETIVRLAQKIKENAEEGKLTRKIAIIFSRKFIITFRRREISWLDALVRQISQSPERYLALGTDALAHRVIDVLTDRFLRGINFFEGVIELAEDESVADPAHFDMGHVLELKRALGWLRQIIGDQRQVISRLASDPTLPIQEQQRRYFVDIEDHVEDIANIIDKQVDSLAGVRDAYFASANVRLSDTMRVLAIITTIAAPLNVLVGLYGMNFDSMPFLHHHNGFWLMVLAMIVMSVFMLFYFRRKKWL